MSELTDRLEYIAKHAVHTVGENLFVLSLDDGIALYEAIKIIKQQQWISCEERLPEDGRYLCTYESDERICVNIGKVIGGEWNDWYVKPTAWMPLPEPWRGGEDG